MDDSQVQNSGAADTDSAQAATSETVDGVRRISTDGITPVPIDLTPDEIVLSERWEEYAFPAFRLAHGVGVGRWRGEPGRLEIRNQPNDEIVVVVRGRIALEDSAGRRAEYGPGEAFLMEKGFSGIWETVESAEKVSVIFQASS